MEMTLDVVRGRISCLEITRLGAVRVGINVAVGVAVMEGVGVSEGNEAITVCTAMVDTSFMKACLVAVALDASILCWHPEKNKDATKITNNEI